MNLLHRSRRLVKRVRTRLSFADSALEAAYGLVSARYFREYWSKAASAVGAEIEEIGDHFHEIRRGDRKTFVWRFMVMLDTFLGRMIVDNKLLTQRLLARHGWVQPPQLEFDEGNVDPALQFLDNLRHEGKTAVVKPKSGSRGRGITTGIESRQELVRAASWAATFETKLIVEQHIEGTSYRLLFLDGELIDTVRRDSPTVIGDGKHNIRDLMRRENDSRLSAPPYTSLIPLKVDLDCKRTLRQQGISLGHVPAKGQLVRVKTVVNQNSSRDNHSIRSGVHPSFAELGRRFARDLNLCLFGMDVIALDISVPLAQSGGVLNELNIPPGLHYHDLVSHETPKVPVGEMVLNAVLSKPHRCGRTS